MSKKVIVGGGGFALVLTIIYVSFAGGLTSDLAFNSSKLQECKAKLDTARTSYEIEALLSSERFESFKDTPAGLTSEVPQTTYGKVEKCVANLKMKQLELKQFEDETGS